MAKRKEIKLDPDKFLNSESIRITLLLSSLYLAAFEILKLAIIEPIKGFLTLPKDYETEIGVKFDEIEQYALIPSCIWLQKMGALTDSEVGEIKNIRNHRNEIAHELPSLLVGEGIGIDLDLFNRMRELLRKIDVFWAKFDIQIELRTAEIVDMYDVRDEDILSSREIILDVIVKTVAEYLEQLSAAQKQDR